MKKFTLLLLLCCVLHSLHAQDGKYIVDMTGMWYNLWRNSIGGPPPYHRLTTITKFSGDTVIGVNHYRKIMETEEEDLTNWYLKGFIREDSIGRVYFIRLGDTIDRLMYDFSMEEGDFCYITSFFREPVIMRVESVDTNFIYDKERKIITFESWGDIWVEGIGCLRGILKSNIGGIVGVMHDLNCYFQNDILTYHNTAFQDCYLRFFTGQMEFKKEPTISIFPNPAIRYLSLKVDQSGNKSGQIQILDVLGKEVYSERLPNTDFQIKIEDWQDGLYFIHLKYDNGLILTEKFIKL